VKATPARVWQEFLTFERMAAWFGHGHRLDVYVPALGGEVMLSVDVGSERRSFGGEILVFESGRELTFANNWTERGWALPTLITFHLRAHEDACHVELFHHGFERLGASADTELQSYEAGWHSRHLETLKAVVEGP
jgi:uncharacterized protein YndB with AHSA1/START domain